MNLKRVCAGKKGVMGIETLIIFIAMILVAGVAAFVLIRTSGLLQQRSLAVSNEAIERVSTGFEFVQVIGNTDPFTETVTEFEILTRLAPGSADIQMNTVGLTFTSGLKSFGASISHEKHTDFTEVEITFLDNSTPIGLYNLDNSEDDEDIDTVVLVWNYTDDNEALLFDISGEGDVYIDLGIDLESNITIDIKNMPIRNETGGDIFGYVDFNGTIESISGSLNSSETGQDFALSVKNYPSTCSFETLRPEVNYCVSPQIGDADNKFEAGELLVIRYKIKDSSQLTTDNDFEFNLIPKAGLVANLNGRTPEVFTNYKTLLWP